MKQSVTKTFCDICKSEILTTPKNFKYPVIFHTEQTEGRSVKPHISVETLDVCEDCSNKILKVDGWGAQGHNNFKIREDRNHEHISKANRSS